MDMRSMIRLVEGAGAPAVAGGPNLDKAFVAKLRKRFREGGFYGEYEPPEDDAELVAHAAQVIRTIDHLCGISPSMTIFREEHRPKDTIRNPGTLGVYWSWNASAAHGVYGVEHGSAVHGAATKLVVAFYEADVLPSAVDWVATVAANLAIPDEKEINLREGATVSLEVLYLPGNKEVPMGSKPATITNITQYDNM